MVLQIVVVVALALVTLGLAVYRVPEARTRLALWIVVVTLWVATAVWVFLSLRSPSVVERVAEVEQVVPRLQEAEREFHDLFGEYVLLSPCPEELPGAEPVALSPECIRAWAELGVSALDPLYCQYVVVEREGGVAILATCDTDGDGARATWEADLETLRRTSAEGVY